MMVDIMKSVIKLLSYTMHYFRSVNTSTMENYIDIVMFLKEFIFYWR